VNDFTDFEDAILALAGKSVRKVRTLEGSKFYGLPIGAPITQDIIDAKKAEASAGGKTPPKNALTSSIKPNIGGANPFTKINGAGSAGAHNNFQGGKQAGLDPLNPGAAPKAPKPAKPVPDFDLQLKKSTLVGPLTFKVGEATYNAPEGSKLIKANVGADLTYVLTPDNKIHALVQSGEVEIPKNLAAALVAKFKGDFKGDDKYSVEEFDSEPSTNDLKAFQVGSKLVSDESSFTKQDDGSWIEDQFGIVLEDSDLQEQVDTGELQPILPAEQIAEDIDFASMSAAEAKTELENLPEGTLLKLGDIIWEKNDSDSWTNLTSDEEKAPTSSNGALATLRKKLSVPTPEEAQTLQEQQQNKKDAAEAQKAEKQAAAAAKEAEKAQKKADEEKAAQAEIAQKAKEAEKAQKKAADENAMIPDGEDKAEPLADWEKELLGITPDNDNAPMDEPAPKAVEDYEVGDKIASQEVLDALPDGTHIAVLGDPNVKKSNGVWVSQTYPGLTFEEKDFESSFELGSATIQEKAVPPLEPEVEQSAEELLDYLLQDEPVKQPEAPEVPDAPVKVPSVEDLSKNSALDVKIGDYDVVGSEAKEALDALEAHSGFQVKYGFNSLPEGHLFKDATFRDVLVAEAKAAFPDEKPKVAVVKMLKQKLGIDIPPTVADVIPEDAVSVQLGGPNGESYPETVIAHAIEAMKASPSVQVKSILAKAGNPLAKQDQHSLIGFIKDKKVQKQTYIDFLEAKLASAKKSETPDDAAPEVNEDFELSKADTEYWTSLPVGTKSTAPSGKSSYTKQEDGLWKSAKTSTTFDDADMVAYAQNHTVTAPETAKPVWEDPSQAPFWTSQKLGTKATSPEGDITFTLVQDNKWDGKAGGVFTDAEMAEYAEDYTVSAPEPKVPSEEEQKQLTKDQQDLAALKAKLAEPDDSPDFTQVSTWDDAPVGTVATEHDPELGDLKYTKQEDGKWQAVVGSKKTYASKFFADYAKEPNSDFSFEEPAAPVADEPEEFKEEFWAAKPVGTKIVSENGITYTKVDEKDWKKDGTDIHSTSTQVADAAKSWSIISPNTFWTQTSAEPEAESKTPMNYDQVINAPMGSVVENVWGQKFTKSHEHGWTKEDGTVLHEETLGLLSTNGSVPLYYKGVPEQQTKHKKGDHLTAQDINELPIGSTVYYSFDGEYSSGHYRRTSEDEWTFFNDFEEPIDVAHDAMVDSSKLYFLAGPKEDEEHSSKPNYAKTPEAVSSKTTISEDGTPDAIEFNKSGLTPGKYATATGKVYMVVKNDGTGVYVNKNGDVQNISVAKVKANYAAGMNTYFGVPDEMPVANVPNGTAAKKAPKKVENLPDGIYFNGLSSDPKTNVFEVVNGKLKLHTPLTKNDKFAVGQAPTPEFVDDAPAGAVITKGTPKSLTTFTKDENGNWNADNGVSFAFTKANIDNGAYYTSYYKIKIGALGEKETNDAPMSKLTTPFKKGQILDASGTTVLPEGYFGGAHFLGAPVTIPEALEHKAKVDAFDMSNITAGSYQQLQDQLYIPDLSAKVEAEYGSFDMEKGIKFLQVKLGDWLGETSVFDLPDSEASNLFEFDSNGHAKLPEAVVLAVPSNPNSVAELNNFAKVVSKEFGNGKILAQNFAKLDKWDKKQWVVSFMSGDMAQVYKYEVTASAAVGKPHPAGYLHPGFSGNTETQKIVWQAAVPGEVPAGEIPEGNWSPLSLDISAMELDNYLIAAQMQNPTYLNKAEKRAWVTAHRKNQKKVVDKLSVTAKGRKDSGIDPVSLPPVWTENIEPAQSYAPLFDDTKFPLVWSTKQAMDYANAHYSELEPYLKEQGIASQADVVYSSWASKAAVTKFFQERKQEYDAQQLIPVYTKKPNQTVQQSTHAIIEYGDQFGGNFLFKPWDGADKWRAESEHLGNQLGKLFGFKTADSKLVELDGHYGQLQKDVGGVGDMVNFDYSNITAMQAADVAMEHVLDWQLDNDDTRGANAIILPDGHIVGIDKGRAFKHVFNWKGLDHQNGGMNTNAHTVFDQMYDGIKNGSISKEIADAAFLAAHKRAVQMSKVSDERLSKMVSEGLAGRPAFQVNVTIDGKTLPNNMDGLVQAFLHRKNNLPKDIDAMWASIYEDAGLGELPEPPVNPLGEVISGLDDERLHEEVLQLGASGKSTMLAGSHFLNGSATLWTDKGSDNTQNVNGEFYLTPKKQQEILGWLEQRAKNLDTNKSSTANIEDYDTFAMQFVGAAKTISFHADDGQYNELKMESFELAKKNIESDLAEWSHDLEGNSKLGGEDAFKFKSGKVVPMTHVDQYKLMLDYYNSKVEGIEKAKAEQVKAPKQEPFTTTPINHSSSTYVNSTTGEKLKKLTNGQWLKTTKTGVEVSPASTYSAGSLTENGWTDLNASEESNENGVKISLISSHDLQGDTVEFEQKLTTQKLQGGVSGQDYEVELPTGEKIWFRNSNHTNTLKSQEGKMSFRIEGVSNTGDSQARIQNVIAQLEAMGISMKAAEPEDAERQYWHEMYGVLKNRKHKTGSIYAKARTKLDAKVAAEKSNHNTFIDDMGEKYSASEENNFWRELYSEFWGAEKIDALIADEKYLPQFEHGNLKNPTMETGKPYWERFDIDVDELVSSDASLYSQAYQPDDILKVVKSGSAMSTEERLRFYSSFQSKTSSSDDQQNGAAHILFTRIQKGSMNSNANFIYHPRLMARTRTFSYGYDGWGKPGDREAKSPSNPLDAINEFSGSTNETNVPHAAALLDSMEMIIFDDHELRNEAIQYLKKLGIEEIRGLKIEDRIVMRQKVNEAIAKVKATWK